MRAHQIIQNYIDPAKIPVEIYKEIVGALKRIGPNPASSEFIQMMYSDERDELELEQLRFDLIQTRAEVDHLNAEAARDRAAVCREFTAAEDDEAEDSRPDSIAKRKRMSESWLTNPYLNQRRP